AHAHEAVLLVLLRQFRSGAGNDALLGHVPRHRPYGAPAARWSRIGLELFLACHASASLPSSGLNAACTSGVPRVQDCPPRGRSFSRRSTSASVDGYSTAVVTAQLRVLRSSHLPEDPSVNGTLGRRPLVLADQLALGPNVPLHRRKNLPPLRTRIEFQAPHI